MSGLLEKKLRYQGKQYSSGSFARGGSGEPHYLTQAADYIKDLEDVAHYADGMVGILRETHPGKAEALDSRLLKIKSRMDTGQ